MDYMKDVEINPYKLDEAWLENQSLMLKYSDLYAQAVFDYKKTRNDLDVVKAKVDSRVRQEAAATGEKITETIVSNRVVLSTEYQEAYKRLIQTEKTMNLLRGAIMAFQSRKSALENLVRLHLGSYYSEPNVGSMNMAIEYDTKKLNEEEL